MNISRIISQKHFLHTLVLFIFLCIFKQVIAINTFDVTLDETIGFEANKGQIFDESGKYRDDVHFVSSFNGLNVFFTNAGVVFYFRNIEASDYEKILAGIIPNPYSDKEWESIMYNISQGEFDGDFVKEKGQFYRIDITFPGAALDKAFGENEKLEKRNYFNPQHPDGLRNIPVFEKIRYKNVYPGIDLIFYSNAGILKYDFEVSPYSDPALIKILYKGHEKIHIDENGNAIVNILPGEIIEDKPISFQGDRVIASNFILSNDTILFDIGAYDKSQLLTIDPALVWSTHFHDGSPTAAFTYTNPVWDSNGNMFMVFNTYNRTTFPTIDAGGTSYYQSTAGSTGLQLVIMKFNTSREIIWATYYASSQAASVNYSNQCLTIDQNNNIYIVGKVFYVYGSPAPAFPLQSVTGAYYETEQGNNRNFILKFSATGQRLWATMFNKTIAGGSSSSLSLQGTFIDTNNKLVIAGYAYTGVSGSWQKIPLITPGGVHYYRNNPVEAETPTLHRFSALGALEWGTYISQAAASTYNSGATMTMDVNNNIFVSGSSTTSTFTTVTPSGAYQDGSATAGRKISIFKFSNTGSLVWSTLYGGTTSANSILWQDTRDMKVASNGDLFIVGRTNTTNFPTSAPSGQYIKSTLSTGSTSVCDGVILQFTNNGVRRWATYYGGNGTSDGTDFFGLGIDGSDNIIVAGLTRSTLFSTQSKTGSYNQSSMTGDYAIILSQFNISGVRQWATYFGHQTWGSTGGFGLKRGLCGSSFIVFGTVHQNYSITTLNPGGGAYFQSLKEGSTGATDIITEFSIGGGGTGGTPGIWGWTGAVNTDWFEPCNWDKFTVPTLTSPVLIPGAPTNQPVIAGSNAHCLNIEIQSSSGALLTIQPTGDLQVHQ